MCLLIGWNNLKNEKRTKWETRERKIKADVKNRKKVSTQQRRNESKKKIK